jgi:hypothetical protein
VSYQILVAFLAGCGVVLARDHRLRMGMLALIYLSGGVLLLPFLPAGIPMAKVAVGICVCGILLFSRHAGPARRNEESAIPTGTWFRSAALLLITLPVYGAWQVGILSALPVTSALGLAGLLLVGQGFLLAAVSGEIVQRCSGLLTILTGFDVVFTPLEPSLALTSLLAAVHIGLALTAAYFLSKSRPLEDRGGRA